jgi:hypothetical protein
MSIKIYLHVEEKGYAEKTSKIQVPKSWLTRPVGDVIGLFLKPYNEKNVETVFDLDNVHLAKSDGSKIYSNDVVETVLEDHADYYIKLGRFWREAIVQAVDSGIPQQKCKNYGCNKQYNEDENCDDSCRHHTGPPIFHDTMKCWSCCKDKKKAYDFESFQLIEGCAVGRHSNVPKTIAIAPSPTASSGPGGLSSGEAAAPQIKSIASYNNANPDAASAVASVVKNSARKSSRNADGVTAKCQRKGCQKVFNIAENTTTSCTYHKGNAIFHDAVKSWSCCPDRRCFDFDEFLAVPGCAKGLHDDGEIDLQEA